MPSTYTLISSNVLTSSAASVTFSAIPSTYTDLVLRCSVRSDGASTVYGLFTTFNNDVSSTAYSFRTVRGNGASATSNAVSGYDTFFNQNALNGAGTASNTFSNVEIYIPSYLISQNKPMSSFTAEEDNATTAWVTANAALYSSTSAISTIKFTPSAGGTNFVTGSSFYLYGIKNS